MAQGFSYDLSQTRGAPVPPEPSPFETLSNLEQDLKAVMEALALLGVARCSQCRNFFRCSDPGALFDCGTLICYGCIPVWWSSESSRLNIADRERIAGKLASWLRKNHGAKVMKEIPESRTATGEREFQIVTTCVECHGSGKLLEGERCRFCNGLGTVWIVVPR
jgi:mono/diheme cytochrome c family protein